MSSKYFNENDEIYKNGLEGEKIALNFLVNYKMEIIDEEQHNSVKYDIKTNKNTYEIKRDNNFKKFGSIFLEFQTIYNNSSLLFTGISITEADYYLFICPVDDEIKFKIFEVPTKKLKDYINNKILINKIVVKPANCIGWKNFIIGKNYGYILSEDEILKMGCVYDVY